MKFANTPRVAIRGPKNLFIMHPFGTVCVVLVAVFVVTVVVVVVVDTVAVVMVVVVSVLCRPHVRHIAGHRSETRKSG